MGAYAPKKGNMKNKDYKGVCKLINKDLKRKTYPFMDFGEVHYLKYPKEYKYPIEKHYEKPKKKGFFWFGLGLLIVLVLYISMYLL